MTKEDFLRRIEENNKTLEDFFLRASRFDFTRDVSIETFISKDSNDKTTE